MKKSLTRPVVFFDTQAKQKFLIPSTIETKEKTTLDGQEYPLVKIDISAASHPHYTGKKVFVDTAGRVEKFKRRYAQASQQPAKTTQPKQATHKITAKKAPEPKPAKKTINKEAQ